ncbi:hypothetical protein Srubr_45730 [Streptomyces rubradiris]|uniref:Carrier domain-containing protein n=1 Tax=Streptomyces rubradiris TaxID=285531 RepID=A0ABQ3RFT7_STRRR|nr:hypothetical protein GCM10018792_06530 [Streptomyces rubradiris]GHI54727.1 hypothetical protein Srubr_45730 [Streptomyces rubradiris]
MLAHKEMILVRLRLPAQPTRIGPGHRPVGLPRLPTPGRLPGSDLRHVLRARALLDIVRRDTAAVFGHAGPDDVDPARSFKDIGIDSLTAVELRDQMTATTGLQVPPTVLSDCPTPAALAERLAEEAAAELSGVRALHRELVPLQVLRRRRRRHGLGRGRGACSCWSGCPTPGGSGTRCWPWCGAARSTRTAPATV